jgi:hypothetical protein
MGNILERERGDVDCEDGTAMLLLREVQAYALMRC